MNSLFNKKELELLLEQEQFKSIAERIKNEHPADVAEILELLEPEEQTQILKCLASHVGASAISELDPEDREELLENMDSKQIFDLVDEMSMDDAAEIVEELDQDKAKDVLDRLEPEDSADIKEILSHKDDTASRIMDPELLSVHESRSVGETLDVLKKLDIDPEEDIFYVYVVDYQNKLVGIVSLQKLIKNDDSRPIGSIMDRRVISVLPDTDQEKVVQMVQKYNLIAIPVVDENGILKGRITVDDIIDVMEEETTEDFYRLAGFNIKDETRSRIKKSFLRMPWLLVALSGSICGAYIQKRLQSPLGKEYFVMFGPFVSVIAAMGGNVGIQACTTIVRGIATGDIEGRFLQAIYREISIAAMVGVVCALIGGVAAFLIAHVLFVSIVVACSLFVSIMVASTLGALAPATFNKIGVDPTIASGPVVTVSIDMICIVIYFLLAIWSIHIFA